MQYVIVLTIRRRVLALSAFNPIQPLSKVAFVYPAVAKAPRTVPPNTPAYLDNANVSVKSTLIAHKANAAIVGYVLKSATETVTAYLVSSVSMAIVRLVVHQTLAVTSIKFASITSAGDLSTSLINLISFETFKHID
jgi:hypothetical protein